MINIFLFIVMEAVKSIVKIAAAAFAKYVASRIKGRTAPIEGWDGSDGTN